MDMQSFILPANGAATPDSIARKRKMAEAMLQSGMDTSPVASPWQGAARMAQALVGGLSQRKADKQEAEGKKSAKDALAKALMGGDKASMIDAMGNPWMDNASLNLIGDAYERANQPPPAPELKDLGNGQFYQFDQMNPQGGQVFTPQGYQPPPGNRLITGEEAAQMGLPPGAYNQAPDGKITEIGGGKVNITMQDEVNQRRQIAETLGIAPDDPAYKTFVATGKMPREDQSPLTATDKKAILEADEAVAANQQAIDILEGVLSPGADGKSLNDKAGYGATAGAQSWLAQNDPTGGVLFDQEQGNATAELDNAVIGQALGNLKSIFGGNPTEGERKILLDLQGSSSKSPEVRAAIYRRAIDAGKRRMKFNQERAAALRGQEYYKPGGAPSAAQDLGNGWTIQEVP